MRKNIAFLFVLVMLFAFVGCGSQSIPPTDEDVTTQEEVQTTAYEWPTSSYAQMEEEIARLQRLLVDHNINYSREPHPIDAAFNEAMKEAVEASFTGYRHVISEYAEIWQEEMEKYLGLLDEVLGKDHKKMLDANQKKWEDYVDGKNRLDYDVLFRNSGGGTMMGDIARSNQYDKYRDRTLFLETLYHLANDEMYQGWPWPWLDEE